MHVVLPQPGSNNAHRVENNKNNKSNKNIKVELVDKADEVPFAKEIFQVTTFWWIFSIRWGSFRNKDSWLSGYLFSRKRTASSPAWPCPLPPWWSTACPPPPSSRSLSTPTQRAPRLLPCPPPTSPPSPPSPRPRQAQSQFSRLHPSSRQRWAAQPQRAQRQQAAGQARRGVASGQKIMEIGSREGREVRDRSILELARQRVLSNRAWETIPGRYSNLKGFPVFSFRKVILMPKCEAQWVKGRVSSFRPPLILSHFVEWRLCYSSHELIYLLMFLNLNPENKEVIINLWSIYKRICTIFIIQQRSGNCMWKIQIENKLFWITIQVGLDFKGVLAVFAEACCTAGLFQALNICLIS